MWSLAPFFKGFLLFFTKFQVERHLHTRRMFLVEEKNVIEIERNLVGSKKHVLLHLILFKLCVMCARSNNEARIIFIALHFTIEWTATTTVLVMPPLLLLLRLLLLFVALVFFVFPLTILQERKNNERKISACLYEVKYYNTEFLFSIMAIGCCCCCCWWWFRCLRHRGRRMFFFFSQSHFEFEWSSTFTMCAIVWCSNYWIVHSKTLHDQKAKLIVRANASNCCCCRCRSCCCCCCC